MDSTTATFFKAISFERTMPIKQGHQMDYKAEIYNTESHTRQNGHQQHTRETNGNTTNWKIIHTKIKLQRQLNEWIWHRRRGIFTFHITTQSWPAYNRIEEQLERTTHNMNLDQTNKIINKIHPAPFQWNMTHWKSGKQNTRRDTRGNNQQTSEQGRNRDETSQKPNHTGCKRHL